MVGERESEKAQLSVYGKQYQPGLNSHLNIIISYNIIAIYKYALLQLNDLLRLVCFWPSRETSVCPEACEPGDPGGRKCRVQVSGQRWPYTHTALEKGRRWYPPQQVRNVYVYESSVLRLRLCFNTMCITMRDKGHLQTDHGRNIKPGAILWWCVTYKWFIVLWNVTLWLMRLC